MRLLRCFFWCMIAPALVSCTSLSQKPSHRHGRKCPPFSGNFTVKAYQLYPENADFDFNACVLYIGLVPLL